MSEKLGRWRRIAARVDLKTRLSICIAVLLFGILVLAMFAVIGNSRRAVAGEIDAVMRLTSALLDESKPTTADGHLPTILPQFLAVLDHTRHLCVEVDAMPVSPGAQACPSPIADEVPGWFADRVTTPPREMRRLMADAGGKPVEVVIRADPAAEILEAWDDARPLLLLIVAIGFLINAVVVFSVWHALRPIALMRDALYRIGLGELHPGLPETTTPELRSIVEGMAELGANLEKVRAENRRLLRHSLELLEEERRAIARELHDEIGQRLAAMDADAALLQRLTGAEAALQLRIADIRTGVAGLYDGLHVLLARLRPAGLDEFGLGSALRNLAADWSARCPSIRYEVRIEIEHLAGDPLVQAYLYRIAQEALANAARHSGASRISLMLFRDHDDAVHLRIADDGRGLPDRFSSRWLEHGSAASTGAVARTGLGLIGIAERAEIIGADLSIGADGSRGTCIAICLRRLHSALPLSPPGVTHSIGEPSPS